MTTNLQAILWSQQSDVMTMMLLLLCLVGAVSTAEEAEASNMQLATSGRGAREPQAAASSNKTFGKRAQANGRRWRRREPERNAVADPGKGERGTRTPPRMHRNYSAMQQTTQGGPGGPP